MDELAAWAVVLTSPISDYLTGGFIPLDGGNNVGIGINFRGSGPARSGGAPGEDARLDRPARRRLRPERG